MVIVHGWDGYPDEGWFPWLRSQLEKLGCEVSVPQLPNAENPRIYNWVPALKEVVGAVDAQTFFVGHSLGCQTIARLLEGLPQEQVAGGVVFVAGFFKHLSGLEEDPDVQETDQHWLSTPVDFDKIRTHMRKSVAIFSGNDPWVPLDNQDEFRNKLGSEIIVLENHQHFSGGQGYTELPIVLEQLHEMGV